MNEKNTPISDVKLIYDQYGYITYQIGKSIYFMLAKITYERYIDESYQYIIEPFYDIIDGLNNKIDIPGINLELRQEKYYRVNSTPTFISERSFPKSRVEGAKLLKDKNIGYYNPFAWLLDSTYTYSGDKLSLKSEDFLRNVKNISDSKNIYRHILFALQHLGTRTEFQIGDLKISEENRTTVIKSYLYQFYLVESTYYQKIGQSAGRHKITVSIPLMREVASLYGKKIITVEEAMKRLDISSESTFYRRLREYKASQEVKS